MKQVWAVLDQVMDPEIPVISITDLGIVRDVDQRRVLITPTYSGCPASHAIEMLIRNALDSSGFRDLAIETTLSPPWTTDWMSEAGKQKLVAYGIAAPNPKQAVCRDELFAADEAVQCPHCQSWRTHRVSEFGSTACKAV